MLVDVRERLIIDLPGNTYTVSHPNNNGTVTLRPFKSIKTETFGYGVSFRIFCAR